jgi:hypothetical protein
VGIARRLHHVSDGEAVEPEPVLTDVDLVLGKLAADDRDLGRAMSMISPVIEVIGVISACASGGSASRTAESRSATSCRAR